LAAAGYRAVPDVRPERLARKVVDAREAGIPLLAAVGAREAAGDQITLRRRDGVQEAMTVETAIAALREEAFR
jgi:threonyl-tRNA synthetase